MGEVAEIASKSGPRLVEVVDPSKGPRRQDPGMVLFGDGGSVRVDVSRGPGNEWVRLNDLHAASGGDPAKAPAQWLRTDAAKCLIRERCAETHNEGYRTVRGGPHEQGTWADWSIALAFAKWLSPAFHLMVNDDWRRYQEGETKGGGRLEARIDRLERLLERVTERLLLPAPLASSCIRRHEVAYLRREKKALAELGVAVGRWPSTRAGHRVIQTTLEEATSWGGAGSRFDTMPAPLFQVADRALRKLRIDLERMEAIRQAKCAVEQLSMPGL